MSEQEKFLKAIGRNVDKKRSKNYPFRSWHCVVIWKKANLVKLTSQGKNITLLSLFKIAKGLDVQVYELLKI